MSPTRTVRKTMCTAIAIRFEQLRMCEQKYLIEASWNRTLSNSFDETYLLG